MTTRIVNLRHEMFRFCSFQNMHEWLNKQKLNNNNRKKLSNGNEKYVNKMKKQKKKKQKLNEQNKKVKN